MPTLSRSGLGPLLAFARFIGFHLICLGVFWTGISPTAWVLCVGLYGVRMFAVTAGYHRYFAHRSYQMGRVMQFVIAVLAQSSLQKGVLWWAAHHRQHHRYADQPQDVHSPHQQGLFYAHVGWLFSPMGAEPDWSMVRDLTRYPELVWLNRWELLPPLALALLAWLVGGWSGLVGGFMVSTVLLWHATFTINSLSHVMGDRRFDTHDRSTNHWLLALITFGEGWHNNHHYYPAAASQGFYWWELDISYGILTILQWLGLVWNLRRPPAHILSRRSRSSR